MTARVLVAIIVALMMVGCGTDNKARESKREYDRTMMRLQDADKEKAQMQTQIDQLRASLESASAKSKQTTDDLAKMQSRLTQAQSDLDKAQSNAKAAAELNTKLTDLQSQNEKLANEVKALQQQLVAAKESAARMAPSPASQPTLNK